MSARDIGGVAEYVCAAGTSRNVLEDLFGITLRHPRVVVAFLTNLLDSRAVRK